MRLTVVLLLAALLQVSAKGFSQAITLSAKELPLEKVFTAIERQSSYVFFYNEGILKDALPVTIDLKNVPLEQALAACFRSQPFTYEVVDNTIILKEKTVEKRAPAASTPVPAQALRIAVTDSTGTAIPGVTVLIKGTTRGGSTDASGILHLNVSDGDVLVFSYLGMQSRTVPVTKEMLARATLTVVLKPDENNLEGVQVVSTGIYQRDRNSFTGSSSTFTARELSMVSNQNVLQSLKTLDPSFAIVTNNQFGSDPNRLPDIEIRGKSSIIGLTDEYGSNPNQPLFILDGFESTLAIISDLSMDRVASITLLKDAAATAIYGSKAANGIVVIETKKPLPGQLRVSYNLNTAVNFADLTDYNLMNSEEKLQFELLSHFYGLIDENNNIINGNEKEATYFDRLKEVRRGVNTYWANEPLRTGVFQRHTIAAEGGDANLRYRASLNYGNNEGVMKGSNRQTTGGNVYLTYRKGRLSVSNSLSIDYVKANHETVAFSRFSRANPYYRKYNADGTIDKLLESYRYMDDGLVPRTVNVYNPLYDMSNNNMNRDQSQGFTNNFELNWFLTNAMRFRARAGLRKLNTGSQIFRSPFNSEFEGIETLRKGNYTESNGQTLNYDGDVSLTYGKLFGGKHQVNAVAGMRLEQSASKMSSYQVEGFVDDDFANPNFAFGYPEGSRASYQESIRRGAGFYLNTGYSFDQRYLLDATVRSDGSSIYGAQRQFTTIWSVGLGWNIHKEAFFRNSGQSWLNQLRLRGSIGNPGNQNFDDYISMRIYGYNNENRNPFGTSVIITNFGNSGLQWQKTLDRNIGLDALVLNERLRVNLDYFYKNTNPLLVFVTLPSSAGLDKAAQNIGEQLTRGFTAMVDYTLVRQRSFNWRVNLNMRQLKSQYQGMGDKLKNFNDANQSRNLVRYYDGGSPSDLWAVRSVGIDPATGREVFLNKNGNQTFVHDYQDEVVVGNSEPSMEGIIGTNFYYKGFSASVNLRYRLGGQIFMQTLYDKVENISITNVTLNQDKRALYERWQKPGDAAKFKSINNTSYTPMSSRFVADNNVLSGESFSVGYETTTASFLRTVGASSFTVRAYMNDIFYIASVTNERGIDYPFARSVSLSASIRF
ncbi:SusC/RagA family TonB-linked outer membrane protein [Chitinophaga cymbidii]|uniref:SusC/RagA family TonB-linked outer membrane protein n=1 Tax=Chitinophaga cymbidii TaxID=1096750 RepID=A0A512RT07_9BACT|nr:SusC/RagA family TonB-linked outer membrane protein [Chitinophaga cymbidii]GEP98827.1 SusC/RagA family TonB-linked outer membrane protein [Chitinophaga cymbidii]